MVGAGAGTGAENCPNWLVLLDKGCLLHRISSKNGNRESQQTKRSATLPSWLCRFRRFGARHHQTSSSVRLGNYMTVVFRRSTLTR